MRWNLIFAFFAFFLIFGSTFVLAQSEDNRTDFEKAEDDVFGILGEAEGVENVLDEARENIDQNKWDYLGEQWKEILFRNERIVRIDSFLQGINPFFALVLGTDYSFSLIFIFVIGLWVLFLNAFYGISRLFSIFSKYTAFVAALLMTFVLSHLKIFPPENINFYNWASIGIFRILFFREGIWSWVSLLLFFVVYIFLFSYVVKFLRKARRAKEKDDEEFRKERQETEQNILHKMLQTFTKTTPGNVTTEPNVPVILVILGILCLFLIITFYLILGFGILTWIFTVLLLLDIILIILYYSKD